MDIIYTIHGLFVSRVYASSLGQQLTSGLSQLEGGAEGADEEWLVQTLVQIAAPLAVICVVVLVIYAAYLLMSSQGNPDKLKEGKEVLTNAIIGFLIVLLSVAILLVLSESLGLGIYTGSGGGTTTPPTQQNGGPTTDYLDR